jgi:ketosteroid isomerase-like protein
MTTPTTDAVAPIREYFSSFGRGDFDTVKAQFASDALVTVPGTGKLAGEYRGPAGFDEFLETLGAHVDPDRSGFGVEDMAVGDRYVIVRELATLARRDTPDRTWELPLLLRFSVDGSQIVELNIVPEDLLTYDAFWADAAPSAD